MSRRWKKQTVMFVFVMTAMTCTIFGMDNNEDANDFPKQKNNFTKCMISSSNSEEIDVMEQNQKIYDLNNEDDSVMVYEADEKIKHQPKRHKTEKAKECIPQEGEQAQVKTEDQIKIKKVEVVENDAEKQLNVKNNDSTNQNPAPLTKNDTKKSHKSEYHGHTRTIRSKQNEKIPVEISNAPPVQVKHVKPENLFATFLDGEDSVKYALVHTRHKNFIDRIPLQSLSDLNNKLDRAEKMRATDAGIYWNPNALNVVKVHFGALNNRQVDRSVDIFETEKRKLANDVLSRIPDTESPADYDFYFDLPSTNKSLNILALHKQKSKYIGRQWKFVTTNTYQIGDFEPCDIRNRLITKKSTDEINKILLALGFNFPLLLNTKEKNQDGREKRKRFVWDGKYEWDGEKRLYRADVEVAEKKKQDQYENNLQYTLCQKLEESTMDKSAKYLMSSHNYMKANAPPSPYFPKDYFDSPFHSQTVLESWKPFYVVVNDEDVIKAFHNNLCESFEFMMKSRNWPEELWRKVLESERPQSSEMMKLLLDRIKEFPKDEHLGMLLHVNDNGKMTFFDKAMLLTENIFNPMSFAHTNDSLKNFSKKVRAQVYQYMLFFGVVKGDISLCKFANEKGFGVSLQQKTTPEIANALASKYCGCRKKEKINKVKPESTEDTMNDSKKENQIEGNKEVDGTNDRDCLHSTLTGKTALEIATKLTNDGIEGGRNCSKNNFKSIKNYLEGEAKKDKAKTDKTKKDKIQQFVIDD